MDMIHRYANESGRGTVYYIACLPAMASGMRDILVKEGINEDDMKIEESAGYWHV